MDDVHSTPPDSAARSWRIYSLQSVLRCRPKPARGHSMRCGTSSRSNLTTGSHAPKWWSTSLPTPHRRYSVSSVAVCDHMLNLTGHYLRLHGDSSAARLDVALWWCSGDPFPYPCTPRLWTDDPANKPRQRARRLEGVPAAYAVRREHDPPLDKLPHHLACDRRLLPQERLPLLRLLA